MPELFGRRFSRAELEARIGSLAQVAGISEFRYAGGRSDGVLGIRIDTGRLCVELVADRALDIASATLDGVPFMWRSANDIAAPAYYDDRGDAWLRSFFGGWLTTCGLANFGPAGFDAWGEYGLHGRINNTPASEVSVQTRWIGDRCIFEICGVMHESEALASSFELHRRWWTEIGSTTLHLEDRVRNVGSRRSPHMMLYHCNAGFPLVGPAARVFVSHRDIVPRDAQALAGLREWNCGGEPQAGFAEQVFIHTPLPCADGKARASIARGDAGDGRGLGFEIAYDPVALPALFTWRKLDHGDYVMSVEPANSRAIQGRSYAAEHGELPFLEAGEERCYFLDFTALTGEALLASTATIESANAAQADHE
ncbi:MAG: aldose 1-epimerase family protein [Vulcanimicrobiaceae bacterium]